MGPNGGKRKNKLGAGGKKGKKGTREIWATTAVTRIGVHEKKNHKMKRRGIERVCCGESVTEK